MKKNYILQTKNILALCHIINNFEKFNKNLEKFICNDTNRDLVFDLWNISEGKNNIYSKKVKNFYKDHQETINTINKYTNIYNFIIFGYHTNGEHRESLEVIYNYIYKNKKNINKIIEVLEYLIKLNFEEFEFNENIDFTKEIYSINPLLQKNVGIIYLNNIEVIPGYFDTINYKTNNSNFKIVAKISNNQVIEYKKNITLNSLLFDPTTLPEQINDNTIFKPLLMLKEQQQKKYDIIKDTVDLDISIQELETQIISTNNILNNLTEVESKEKLIEILLNIKNYLETLKKIYNEHSIKISNEEPSITKETIENEKKLYLKKKELEKKNTN